jgi:Uma2 family endonuclease
METLTIDIPKEFINDIGEIIYPESDGKPMSGNTKQFEWIATIKGNLDSVFANQTDVFVAGDLLWYPMEGAPHIRVAPDIMVAFGRPKGHRSSYKQWEEDNIPPQVVFEILSPSNTVNEMIRKQRFYSRNGVEEYYIYDPQSNEFFVHTRQGSVLNIVDDVVEWESPLLGVHFVLQDDTLKIYDQSGKPFLTYIERCQAEEMERQAKEAALQAQEMERQAKEDALQALLEEEKAISEKDTEIQTLKELILQAGLKIENG